LAARENGRAAPEALVPVPTESALLKKSIRWGKTIDYFSSETKTIVVEAESENEVLETTNVIGRARFIYIFIYLFIYSSRCRRRGR